MPNVTISLNENLFKLGKKYVEKHNTSLNALIRKLLEETVKDQTTDWIDECFNLMDKTKSNSEGRKWKREDLYDV